jgi:hypothetical protein
LAVGFLAEEDQLLGAGYSAESACFASLAVNDDLTHSHFDLIGVSFLDAEDYPASRGQRFYTEKIFFCGNPPPK